MFILYRLSGIIHVLYAAMNVFLDDETSDEEIPGVVTKIISQEEVQMVIALTEYFQAQRQAYEKVFYCNIRPLVRLACMGGFTEIYKYQMCCLHKGRSMIQVSEH